MVGFRRVPVETANSILRRAGERPTGLPASAAQATRLGAMSPSAAQDVMAARQGPLVSR
jgi:hypothetical protein